MPREPCPLQWPDSGWQRTPAHKRTRSAFRIPGFATVRDEVVRELKRLGATHIVITSDLPIRNDGLPYANGRADDPGVAVYFVRRGAEQVMACDRWKTHAENLRAIQKTVEALRGIDRWGSSQLVQRAFAGFAALPPGSGPSSPPAPRHAPWREVLAADVEQGAVAWPTELVGEELLALAKVRYRRLMKAAHPDAGGTHELAAELNTALAEAERELGQGAAA